MSKRKTRTKADIKKRKAKYTNYLKGFNNSIKKHVDNQKIQQDYQLEMMRKASLIDNIYKAKQDEFAVVKDDKLVLNMDNIYLNDDKALCWRNDDNPILSGLEDYHNYPEYTEEFINIILSYIYNKQKQQITVDNTIKIDE